MALGLHGGSVVFKGSVRGLKKVLRYFKLFKSVLKRFKVFREVSGDFIRGFFFLC